MMTTASPSARSRPAVTAIWCPKLRAKSTTTTRGSCLWSAMSFASESSALPSLTKMSS